jgi:hypothetical protein
MNARLDRASLDALKDDDFAVPAQRKLRINDERHTRLAWHNIDAAQGLTLEDKAEARKRILARAHELAIDTRDWHKLRAISLEAMALNISNRDDHPNKMPFSGVLTRLDEPSDAAPGGSYGRRIIVTTEAAERALPSLLGMAVDFTPSFDGHDAQTKIGIITSANIVGNAIEIEGFVYAADFPETAVLIRSLKNVLGFSFEAQRLTVQDPNADILTITDLAFTGAAILRKDKAAYTTTRLAAKAAKPGELKMTPEELKGLLAEALKPVGERLGALEAAAKPAAPAALTAADVAKAVSDEIARQAEIQKVAAAQAEVTKKAIEEAVAAATKPLVDQIAASETKLKDIEAKAKLASEPAARKTVTPLVTTLLAKAGLALPEGDGKLTVEQIDAAAKTLNLPTDKRIQLKTELARVGAL